MNIDNNQYDLSELFQFDLLKNILLNITTEQKKLRDELNELKSANKNGNENNIYKLFGLEYELNKNSDELNNEKNKNIKGNNDNNKLNIEEINKDINNKNIRDENIEIENDNEYAKKNLKDKLSNKYSDKINNASKDTYLFFIKETQTLAEKINNLENKLTSDFENMINKIETETKKNMNSLIEENKSKYEKLDEQLNNIMRNNAEQDKKIESCILKYNSIDIFNALKDTKDGSNIDATKAMIKILEEKVFQKFQFIEDQNKEFFENITKLIKSNDNNNMQLEKFQKSINDIKYIEIVQVKEHFRKNLTKFERKNEDIINLLSKIEKGLSTKIFNTEKNILEIFEEKDKILNNNKETMNEFQNNLIDIQNELDKFKKKQDEINKDITKDIEEKFNMHSKNLNRIETKLKQIDFTYEVKQFDKDIKEIKNNLKEKITYDNLNDLYKLQANDAEDISNIRKNFLSLQDDIKKCIINYEKMSPKVDAFIEYLIDKKNRKKPKKDNIDINQIVTKDDYEETVKLFTRKIESIFMEIDSFKRNLDDIKLEQNLYEKKDMIIKINEQIHNDIEDNKLKIQKNRNELYKHIKTIEIDIKSLWNELKKKESSDSWLLAKNPIKCFNCASCNNDIKVDSPKEEYIHWKRILPTNRSYNQGKGYSHILEKMSNGLINNNDEKNDSKIDISNQDKDIKNNSTYNINNSTQIEETKMINSSDNNISILKNIGLFERNNSQPKLTIKKGRNQKSINNEKMQLPQVVDMARRKAIIDTFKNISSCTDKDKITMNEYLIKNVLRITSPKNSQIKKKENGSISFIQSSQINNP